jgi:hypothetical protein
MRRLTRNSKPCAGHLLTDLPPLNTTSRFGRPPARPAPEVCRYWPVKHMCEEYWTSLPGLPPASSTDRKTVYIDCQGVLSTPTESPPFSVADHVRLIGVAYSVDDDAEQRITTITQAAEVFVLAD